MTLKAPTPDDLLVKIQAPVNVVWEGRASAISSVNSIGPFDILPDHANMITLVEGAPIVIVTGVGDKTFTFSRAVISVRDNTVSIYADIGSDRSPVSPAVPPPTRSASSE